MILRPYQENIITRTRYSLRSGKKRQLIVCPTGGGKTVMFSYFASEAVKKGNQVLILAHRVELLEQISKTLSVFNVSHGIIAPGFMQEYHKPVQVASVFSVIGKLGKIPTPKIIIIDEAHHACMDSTWEKVLRFYNVYALGVTATPCRLSGEPLGDVFDDMILGPTTRELIELGALCDYKYHEPKRIDTSQIRMRMGDFDKKQVDEYMNRPSITGDIIAEYKKRSMNKRAVFYGCSIPHAESAAEQFKANGIRAASIDGNMDRYQRKRIVDDFKSGVLQVVTNVNIVTEGFDLSAIETVMLGRPTMSLALYLQMVGRALRTMEGKEYAQILDFVNARHTHGLPCEDREWSLSGSMRKKKGEKSTVKVKTCEVCYAVQPPSVEMCKFCGNVFQKQYREIDEVDGELEQVDVQALRKQKRNAVLKEQGAHRTLEQLIALGKQRGYRNPYKWAQYIHHARQAKKLKGIK